MSGWVRPVGEAKGPVGVPLAAAHPLTQMPLTIVEGVLSTRLLAPLAPLTNRTPKRSA